MQFIKGSAITNSSTLLVLDTELRNVVTNFLIIMTIPSDLSPIFNYLDQSLTGIVVFTIHIFFDTRVFRREHHVWLFAITYVGSIGWCFRHFVTAYVLERYFIQW